MDKVIELCHRVRQPSTHSHGGQLHDDRKRVSGHHMGYQKNEVLLGRVSVTDHLALKWLNSIKSPSGRVARWALELQQFQFDVRYRRGKLDVVADALSQQPCGILQQMAEVDTPCKWIQGCESR